MRKQRVRPGMTKMDVVVASARYTPETRRVSEARVFERMGQVWSDILLLDRDRLVQKVEAGLKVVTGSPTALPGEFEIRQAVRLSPDGSLLADGAAQGRDDLGVPTY